MEKITKIIIDINLNMNNLLFFLNKNHSKKIEKFINLEKRINLLLKNVEENKIKIKNKKKFFISIKDSLSKSQIKSKFDIIDFINENDIFLGNCYYCCAWYGIFLSFIDEQKYEKIIGIDIDKNCKIISEEINRELLINNWKYKSYTKDIYKLSYHKDVFAFDRKDGTKIDIEISPNTIINTSCEHLLNFNEWLSKIKKGTLMILQSNNNKTIPEHVNISYDLKSFEKSCNLSKIIYKNEINFENYKRFTIIGYK